MDIGSGRKALPTRWPRLTFGTQFLSRNLCISTFWSNAIFPLLPPASPFLFTRRPRRSDVRIFAFKVLTLTGTGDLILHQGSLLIKPPPEGSPSQNAGWNGETPPEALVVSGGSLGVTDGGAEIASSRSDAPALAVTVDGA